MKLLAEYGKLRETEKELGKSITSKENYLFEPEKKKRLESKSSKNPA